MYDVEIFEANGEKLISTSYAHLHILLLTGHRSPAASGPGRLDAAESLTVTVTHTFNQPKSDGRPAARPPAAPGGGLPLSRAGRSSARLMSGRTEHIKQIQDYVSVRSAAQDLFLND